MNKTTTFWNLIKDNIIEIPIIQRDYAQGREGLEYLRQSFLSNLKQALDGTLSNNEKVLKLDFVYGSIENTKLQPLDGQQRLTTLWLMHWYIALKAEKLNEVSPILGNFSYETRISSREFYQNLCNAENFKKYNSTISIVDYITKQTWFYSAWKQDPTIQAMLRMLGGTKIDDKNGDDIIDGIEELFANETIEDFKLYWEKLISGDSPIIFYYQALKDLGLTDDLYIKMNARGKQLTNFENFKADLIGYIREQVKEDDEWKPLLDVRKGLPIKMDTTWTDVFWKKKSSGYTIDEIYFAFLNRLFWNEFCINKLENDDEETNASFKLFNADKIDKYNGLKLYKYENGTIPLSFFLKMKRVLDGYSKYDEAMPICRWNKDFEFIPKYESYGKKPNETKISTLNQIERIAFFAVCKYFNDEGDIDEVSLRRWMRVVWNLISGDAEDGRSQIRSIEAVKSAIEQIKQLDSHDVYSCLKNQTLLNNKSDFNLRWNEEIEKAIQIIDENGNLRKYTGICRKADGSTINTWEDVIIEAENWGFFKGAIRFLFHNANGEVDWSDFDTKWDNAKKIFKQHTDNKQCGINGSHYNVELLKALISRFDTNDFYNVLWWRHRVFNNNSEVWRYYMLNNNLNVQIHELMMGNTTVKPLTKSSNLAENILYLLSNTNLLDFVVRQIPNSWIRDYHYHTAIYPSYTGVFLNAEKRDNFISTYASKIYDKKIEGTNLLYGSDIYFKWQDKHFQWYRNNIVYLMKDDNRFEHEIKDDSKDNDLEKCYSFKTNDLNYDEILDHMNQLIKEQQASINII